MGGGVPTVLALLALLLPGAAAQAHDLYVDYHILPGRRVQVESWFTTGVPPLSGRVRVLRSDGTLLREMPLDDRGLCVFLFDRPQELRLDVTDDTGHRGRHPKRGKRPILIKAEELLPSYAASVTGDIAACMTSSVPPLTGALLFGGEGPLRATSSADAEPLADRSRHIPFGRIVLGVALLLAVPLLVRIVRKVRSAARVSV